MKEVKIEGESSHMYVLPVDEYYH